jgi:hypothetical protein
MTKQRIALITGANKGIGFEVARQLADKNFRVLIGARDEKAGRAAARKIGASSTFLRIDVAERASIGKAARKLTKDIDHLDVLVNNAGIIVDGDDPILKATPEQFETTMRTHAWTTFGGPSFSAAASEVISPPNHQCFEQRRTIARRRRWLVADLLYFKDRIEWSNFTARCRATEVCCEFIVSWLGPHGYGRSERDPFRRRRRRWNCLARNRGAAASYRQIFAGPESDCVVTKERLAALRRGILSV